MASGNLLCQVPSYLRATSVAVPNPLIEVGFTSDPGRYPEDRAAWQMIDGSPATSWTPDPALLAIAAVAAHTEPGQLPVTIRLDFWPPVQVTAVGVTLAPGSGSAAASWSIGATPAAAQQLNASTTQTLSAPVPVSITAKVKAISVTLDPGGSGQPLSVAELTVQGPRST